MLPLVFGVVIPQFASLPNVFLSDHWFLHLLTFIQVRNAQLLADQEASSWALSKTRLLQASQRGTLNTPTDAEQLLNMANNRSSPLHLIVEEMDSFRQLVEKYTIENEELRYVYICPFVSSLLFFTHLKVA